MSRSKYIYIAMIDYPYLNYGLKYASTVKYEMINWAKENDIDEVSYYRFYDNKPGAENISEDIKQLIEK